MSIPLSVPSLGRQRGGSLLARLGLAVAVCLASLGAAPAGAAVALTDDEGQQVRLDAPAKHVVSLAPHLTEILYAIGAGDKLVGAIDFSDYPEAAKQVPRVGRAGALDIERIRAMAPDLVIAWGSGNPHEQLEKLRSLHIPVYVLEIGSLSDIATAMQNLGTLTGERQQAQALADRFNEHLRSLRETYAQRPPVRIFYQVWDRPVMTVNDHQIISDAMRTCGAVNVFGALPSLVPTVDVEAVLAANPEVLATSRNSNAAARWRSGWEQWPNLLAVQRQNYAVLSPDLLSRMGPRILEGVDELCLAIDDARRKRP